MLEALQSGCETIAQLVGRIYSGLHPSVVPAAADSVLAHLIKLSDEGKVGSRRTSGVSPNGDGAAPRCTKDHEGS